MKICNEMRCVGVVNENVVFKLWSGESQKHWHYTGEGEQNMRMICIGKIEGVQVESSVMERLLREKNGIGRDEMEGAGE